MSRSVLVTGGAGFIGSHLVEALVSRGDRVRVLDDLSSGRLENLESCPGDVEVLLGDVRDRAAVERAMDGVDAVFHEAAIVSVARSFTEPVLVDGVNVGGSVNVLAAARRLGVGLVVFASSAAVYGDTEVLPVGESTPASPCSPYGVGKLAVEGYAGCLADAGGPATVCLRYFNVYGPRQDPSSEYSGVIARFISRAAAGETLTIYGDGAQTRDFVYVGDVVQANLLALAAAGGRTSVPVAGAGTLGSPEAAASAVAGGVPETVAGATAGLPARLVVNVGSGRQTSVLQLAEAVARIAAASRGYPAAAGLAGPPAGAAGRPERFHFEPARPGDIRDSCADIKLARAALRYGPAWSLADGLRATWESLTG
jgi:UDP-glucose 4-epimerase